MVSFFNLKLFKYDINCFVLKDDGSERRRLMSGVTGQALTPESTLLLLIRVREDVLLDSFEKTPVGYRPRGSRSHLGCKRGG